MREEKSPSTGINTKKIEFSVRASEHYRLASFERWLFISGCGRKLSCGDDGQSR
jgi:hypothetical protein